eukprot:TRINITY_DN2445_c0_g5_i1.p1 TRINITY_DN2445_c0_g5~~TRINITY_DN2445_c0_g5_i1.p1  ORF type:complete len:394 (+),score=94.99 TRINITY_DN2445_c0_g5_i1:53-1234(+)
MRCVIAHVDPDGVRDPCLVATDGAAAVGTLLPAVHEALALERPIEEWDFAQVDGDGVERPLRDDGELLADVGIIGAREVVVARLGDKYMRRQELRARGIDGEAAAWEEFQLLLGAPSRGEAAVPGDGALVAELIAGSGWVARAVDVGNDSSALHLVVKHGKPLSLSTEPLRLLIATGADVDAKDADGFTPLHHAAIKGDVGAIRTLFEFGAALDVMDHIDDYYLTPLHDAADHGHVEAVRLLIDCGADVGATSALGETPLHRAAGSGQVGAMRVLLERGADVAGRSDLFWTPLHDAADLGFLDAARLLLDRGADVDSMDVPHEMSYWTGTPLHAAARSGQCEVIRLLLERGATVGKKDQRGCTPLDVASTDEARMLIKDAKTKKRRADRSLRG